MGVIDELILRITADPSGLVAGLGTAQAEVAGFAAETEGASASTMGLSESTAAAASNSELLGGSLAASGASAGELRSGAKDAEGATRDLGSGMENAGTTAVSSGGMFGSFGSLAAVGVGVAGVAIAGFAMKSASDVGGAYKSIIAQTGATGDSLNMLKGDFNTLAGQVPNSLQDIATAESDVYDKSKQLTNGVQLTGPALDSMTEKFLNWSRISGESVKSLVDETSAWAGAFKMNADQASASMDIVNSASQKSGESVSVLASDLQKVAPQASLLGLSFGQTTAAVTGFEEAGLKATAMQTSMSKVFQDAQKDHQNSTQRWEEDVKAIGDYVSKGASAVQGTKEWDQVTKDFSGKTLTSLITAVKEGKLSISDLDAILANSKNNINQTADSTKTFGQNLTQFKQQLEVAFAPLGSSLIQILTNLLNAIKPIIPIITQLVSAFTSLPMPIQEGALALVTIVGGVKILGPLFEKMHLDLGSIMSDFTKLKSAGSGLFDNLASGNVKGALSSLTSGGGSKAPCPVDASCIDKATKSAGNLKGELGEVEQAGGGVTGELEDGGVAMESVASQGGILGGVMDALPGPLNGIVGSIGGMGEGIAGAAAGAGEGGLLGSVMGILASIPIIGWAILAVVGVFVTLTATSETFRSMLGGVLNTVQQIFGWVEQVAGALMSGNFSKAGDLLKSGFEGAINALKNFDYGAWAGKMVQSFVESFTTIQNFFIGLRGQIVSAIGGIDWGGVAGSIMSGLGAIFDFGNKVRDSFLSIDWGGAFAGLLDSADNILTGIMNTLEGADWSGVFTQIINMIGGVFDSLFGGSSGGGGSAGSKVSDGMSGSLSKGVQKAGPDIIGKLGDVLKKLLEITPEIFYKIGTGLISALEKVDWGSVFGKIGSALLSAMSHALGGLGGLIAGALGGLGGMISGALGGAGGFITGMISQIPGFVTQLASQIMNGIKTFSGGLGKWFYDALITVYQFDQKLWNQLLNTVKTYMGGFGKWLYDAAISVFALDKKIGDAIKNAVTGFGTWLWDGASTLGSKLWSSITGALGQFGTWLWGLISGTGTKLWTAISSAVGGFGTWLWGLISGTGTKLWTAITTALGTFGSWLWGLISDTGTKLWTAISSALAGFGSWLWGLISDTGSKLWGAITGALGSFGSWLWGLISPVPGELWGGITGALGSFGSWLWGLISGIPGQLGSGIQGAVSGFGSWLISSIGGLAGAIGNAVVQGANQLAGGLVSSVQSAAGNIVSTIEGAFTNISIPIGITIAGHTWGGNLQLAEGGIINPRPGGVAAILGEAGEREYVIPEHKLQHFAQGGIVQGGSTKPLPSANVSGQPARSGNVVNWSGNYEAHIHVSGNAGNINENKLVQLLLDAEIAQGLPF